MAAARQPSLYIDCGIADKPEHRLAMINLFMSLVVDRLQHSHKQDMQALVELFAADIEGNLREQGVSDVAIPRHMRDVEARYVSALLALSQSLPLAAAGDTGPLFEALSKMAQASNTERLVQKVVRTHQSLAALQPESILAGKGLEP